MTNRTILRTHPNILITGTPGTGKTTFASLLATTLSTTASRTYTHKNISHLVSQSQSENTWHSGYDERWQSYILDEDKVVDALEPEMGTGNGNGGVIVDYHGCDFFPERWFDLIVVLRAHTSVLYDRLAGRKYPKHKIDENITSEIMNVIHDEAFESYNSDLILVLESNTEQDLQDNVARIKQCVEQYQPREVPAAPPATRWEEEESDDSEEEEDVSERIDTSSWPKPVAAEFAEDEDEPDEADDMYMAGSDVGVKRKRG